MSEASGAATAAEPGVQQALGLHAADGFQTVRAPAAWPGVTRQALWYFREETIALPVPGAPVAGFARGVDAFEDVRAWSRTVPDPPPAEFPPLVWVAAPDALRGARIDDAGRTVLAGGRPFTLELSARHPLNRAWLDASSFAFLASRPVAMRGTIEGERFVARTLWPEDFALRRAPPPGRWRDDGPAAGVRALMREAPRGGADAPFQAWTLWQRNGVDTDWAGRPAIAFVVNGAQGDDDEAHAGHFAIVTGRARRDGAIGDWLVNNFYSLDMESEKGIVAAPVPLDNYQGDVNAGQSWYRPSHLLVCVLDDARAARLVQAALGRVYHQFWRHQLVYYHPRVNCTSISLDTLAALGWRVPGRGPTSRAAAWIGLPWLVAREAGVAEGLRASDYLSAEVTRMLPAAAFEQAAASLLALVERREAPHGRLAQWLARDVAAVALLRIPQFPSSRAWGDFPVVSLAEYRARLPSHRRDRRVVPVPPRPFPRDLRDDDLRRPPPHPSAIALGAWAAVAGGAAIAALRGIAR